MLFLKSRFAAHFFALLIALPLLCLPANTQQMFNTPGPAEVLAKIAESAGGATEAVEVSIYPDLVIMILRNPKKPEIATGYTFRFGAVSRPTDVLLGHGRKVDDYAYPLDNVDWNVVPRLVAESLYRLGADNRASAHVVVQRDSPSSDEIRMQVIVKDSRITGRVDADSAGRILKIHKS